MKKGLLIALWAALTLVACNSDDDICTNDERSPRLKLKFKDQNNKLKTLDTLFINVDYGDGERNVIARTQVDSVLVPLRIDGAPYTDLKIFTSRKATSAALLRVNYTERLEYVSSACGIRKLYEKVSPQLLAPSPVTDIEPIQKEILNEDKTHIYLVF